MIKILLLLPEGITEKEIEITYNSIESAQIIDVDTVVYLYSDDHIPESIASKFTWRFSKENTNNFMKLILASKDEDVIIPIFAGDIFEGDSLQQGIELLEAADKVTIYGNGGGSKERQFRL